MCNKNEVRNEANQLYNQAETALRQAGGSAYGPAMQQALQAGRKLTEAAINANPCAVQKQLQQAKQAIAQINRLR